MPELVRYLSAPGLLCDAITDVLHGAFPGAEIVIGPALPADLSAPLSGKRELLVIDDTVCTPAELLTRLSRAAPRAPVIYLTGQVDLAITRETLAAGAAAVVLKTEPIETFRHVLRFVQDGGRYVSPELVTQSRGRARPWSEWAAEHLPAFVHVVQGERVAYVNHAITERLGVARGEIVGRNFWMFVAEDQQGDLRSFVDAWFAGQPPSDRVKVEIAASRVGAFWLHSTIRLARSGCEPALAVVSTDISDAMRRADAFGCALSQCKLGPNEPMTPASCRRCIYGLLDAVSPEPTSALAPASGASRLEALPRRQRAVLRLIASGRTNRQIAAELAITEATVKAYVHQIMRALGVRNRTSAALAYRAGGEPDGDAADPAPDGDHAAPDRGP